MHAAVRRGRAGLVALAMLAAVRGASSAEPPVGQPSRAALEHCTWERLADAKLGLAAWVQRCDYGFRKIDFLVAGSALAQRSSDGGAPQPVVEVFALEPGESAQAGVKRIFAAHTDGALAKRCVLAPWQQGKAAAGRERFTFVPDPTYAKELARTASPDEVPEPPCGPYGDAPDGIQYFETQPKRGVAKVLFVHVGQDEPLFDEQTLSLLPAP